jgi:hypothetical protein
VTASIVSAYVSNNSVAAAGLTALIAQVYSALTAVSDRHRDSDGLKPATPIKKSITSDLHHLSRGWKEVRIRQLQMDRAKAGARTREHPAMTRPSRIGAKNVFQVHGIDAAEKVVIRKQLRRGQVLKFFASLPPCLIGMEACATAHYWARELTKLGHEVRLMPAKDVKPYVKRNWDRSADHIRARSHSGCIQRPDTWRHPNVSRRHPERTEREGTLI